MPFSFAARSGPSLARSPSHRQQADRRRLAVFCGVVALAIASGVIGSLVRPDPTPQPGRATIEPFSYFPAQ